MRFDPSEMDAPLICYPLRNKNFSIVTVNPFDTKDAIEKHNKRFNVKYPSFINDGMANVENYKVDSYPTFYLVDKNGEIIKGFRGYYKLLDEELDRQIDKYLSM